MNGRCKFVLAALALWCGSAAAQIHGVPAGATSLGPNGYGPPQSPQSPQHDGDFEPRSLRLRNLYFPVAMPYYFFGYPDQQSLDDGLQAVAQRLHNLEAAQNKTAAAQPTVVVEVNIGEKGATVAGARNGNSAAAPASSSDTIGSSAAAGDDSAPTATSAPTAIATDSTPQPAQDFAPTLLVFRDGHRTEVRDYAISSGELIDLAPGGPSYALTDLDLAATTAANRSRGVAFVLP